MGEHLERPELLARQSEYGYVTINPDNPDTSRALRHEPEPITPDQAEQLHYRQSLRRRQQYQAVKGSILASLDQLAQDADHRQRRLIRNAERAIKSL